MSVFSRISAGLLASALSFSVHAANNQPQNPPQQPAPAESAIDVTNTPEVIQALYVSNASEVKVAELVSQKSSDQDLLIFAEELNKDHAWQNKLIELVANVKSIGLKTEELSANVQKIAADQEAAYNALSQTPDTDFRKTFLEGAIADHQKALELYSQIEAGTSDDFVKLAVAVFRQQVEKHLADAQKLQAGDVPPGQGEAGTN